MAHDSDHPGGVAATGGPVGDEAMVEAVIADCGGDPREAVRALLKINQTLARERRELVSAGYARDLFRKGRPSP